MYAAETICVTPLETVVYLMFDDTYVSVRRGTALRCRGCRVNAEN